MSNIAQSEYLIDFIMEKGREKRVIKGKLKTVLGPLIIRKIIEKLPIVERGIVLDKNRLVIGIKINAGWEKKTMTVKKGEIAYQALGDELVIFFDDLEQTFSRVNVIGNLLNLDDIDNFLKKIPMSIKVTIKLAD
ncbi:MAG: cyclophilin-like fold protein [Candidatus Helarchaeota archaeon]